MPNKKNNSKDNRYPVPQLRVASINLFLNEGRTVSDDQSANESKSTNPRFGNKKSSNLPEFYEAKIKPKNYDPL